jgi:hypothetical protein
MVDTTEDRAPIYDRADELIALANTQAKSVPMGDVSVSTLYAAARYNALVAACGHDSSEGMRQNFDEIVDYFVSQYSKMLQENLDDYIANFEAYKDENRGD